MTVPREDAPAAGEEPVKTPPLRDRAYPPALRDQESRLLAARREVAQVAAAEGRVGFGLSGGGIRSATFCLGLFQGLARQRELLRRIDFLSTVSGGGYFGAFYGRLIGRDYVKGQDDVEAILTGDSKPDVLRNLRENGRYLSPNGAGDLLLAAAVLLRNWVSIQLVLLLFLLAGFLALQSLRGILQEVPALAGWVDGWATGPGIWWSPFLVLPAVTFLFGAFPIGWAYWLIPHENLAIAEADVKPGVALARSQRRLSVRPWTGLALTFILFLWLTQGTPEGASLAAAQPDRRRRRADPGRDPAGERRRHLARHRLEAGNPRRRSGLPPRGPGRRRDGRLSAPGGCRAGAGRGPGRCRPRPRRHLPALSTVRPDLAFRQRLVASGDVLRPSDPGVSRRFEPQALLRRHQRHRRAAGRRRGPRPLLAAAGEEGSAGPPDQRDDRRDDRRPVADRAEGPQGERHGVGALRAERQRRAPFAGSARHGRSHRSGGVRGRDLPRQDEVSRFDYPSSTPDGHPVFTGEMLPLGSWVGISGAAVSTGNGARTSLGLSLLAGLANVRLGRWWDSGVERSYGSGARTGARPNLGARCEVFLARLFPVQVYLLDEFLARFPGTARRHWYLSDGGHFEDLGGYELVRRRLPLIVLVDAEQDTDYGFEALANLVRKARLDFGAEIRFLNEEELDREVDTALRHCFGTLEKLRRGTWKEGKLAEADRAGLSQAHAALARIHYPGSDDPPSRLLLIKPALTGDEPEDLLQYHEAHPDFPQESTADQFFDEAQWESYRKLGEHVAEKLFAAPAKDAAKWCPRRMGRSAGP
jgi:hypothetical protein